MKDKKGLVSVIVLAVLGLLIISAIVFVSMGCGELLQTRVSNNMAQAYYNAVSGAELMYAALKDRSLSNQAVVWPQSRANTDLIVNGINYGTFNATANTTPSTDEFMIVANGTFGGRTQRVTVKYGFRTTYMNGLPLGCVGPMTLDGSAFWFLQSWVNAQGPIESAGSITPNSNTNNQYVRFTGDVLPNQPLTSPNFWVYSNMDTTGAGTQAGIVLTHADPNKITQAEAQAQEAAHPGALAVFNANDVNHDAVINNKDAFYYYYTTWLNDPANNRLHQNLGINPGGANYYSGTKTLGPFTIPAGTNIIFVDGDVNIIFNAQKWWPNTSDITIVSTQDITIVQPMNGADDRLNLIAGGDILTGGINLGDLADVKGNMNDYAGENFRAILGGNSNGSIFAGGNVDVDTGLPLFLFNRNFKQGTDNWEDSSKQPLGLPSDYPKATLQFVIKSEDGGSNGYKPRWQLR